MKSTQRKNLYIYYFYDLENKICTKYLAVYYLFIQIKTELHMYLKILFVNYSRVGDGRAGGGVCVASKDRHPQLLFCTTHTQGAYNISKQCQNRGMFMI